MEEEKKEKERVREKEKKGGRKKKAAAATTAAQRGRDKVGGETVSNWSVSRYQNPLSRPQNFCIDAFNSSALEKKREEQCEEAAPVCTRECDKRKLQS